MQKSSQLHFSVSIARALGSSTASYSLQGLAVLVCFPGPLSPFHCEFHGGQVVPALDWFLSDLAVNTDVWLGPHQSCQLEYLYVACGPASAQHVG